MLPPVQPTPAVQLPDTPALRGVELQLDTASAERELEHDWQRRDYHRAARSFRRLGVRRSRQCPRCRLFTVRAHCQHCGFTDTGPSA